MNTRNSMMPFEHVAMARRIQQVEMMMNAMTEELRVDYGQNSLIGKVASRCADLSTLKRYLHNAWVHEKHDSGGVKSPYAGR